MQRTTGPGLQVGGFRRGPGEHPWPKLPQACFQALVAQVLSCFSQASSWQLNDLVPIRAGLLIQPTTPVGTHDRAIAWQGGRRPGLGQRVQTLIVGLGKSLGLGLFSELRSIEEE